MVFWKVSQGDRVGPLQGGRSHGLFPSFLIMEKPARAVGGLKTAKSEARCPRCAAPLDQDLEALGWAISPFLRDSFAVIGTGTGGAVAGFYSFQRVMPRMVKLLPGRPWLQSLAGAPPIMLVAMAGAGLAGGALPAFAQLLVTTYHASSTFSSGAISKATTYVEEYREKPASKEDKVADGGRHAHATRNIEGRA
ncbi:hypothetical protein KFL_000780050 [Klebsormidium nitens]|uniref:Transmembrane protein n=1 Tax=Klebsormidium nitens TaxID=105231 RepID=A0A1Y1HT99_KLENI|nr:hypothetical protein KFL_000780050 [Klebsormidium nitens]|eukprot:GAQ81343.1 hypothetical protein KFL_000780050 [Klebsormidium nitens]